MNVVPLARQRSLNELWEEYRTLAQAMNDNPRLMIDRDHVEATIRAHQRFATAFLAAESAA